MKITKTSSLVFLLFLYSFGKNNLIEWNIQSGYELNTTERNTVLHLADTLGIRNIYSVQSGNLGVPGKYYGIVVKSIAFRFDTLEVEKWLYLWKKKWLKETYYQSRQIWDTSIVINNLYTGSKAIQEMNFYIYSLGNIRKRFHLNDERQYIDIKRIIDCILSGKAIMNVNTYDDFSKLIFIDFSFVFKMGSVYNFEFRQTKYSGISVHIKLENNECKVTGISRSMY
jgi:hypothetical protein